MMMSSQCVCKRCAKFIYCKQKRNYYPGQFSTFCSGFSHYWWLMWSTVCSDCRDEHALAHLCFVCCVRPWLFFCLFVFYMYKVRSLKCSHFDTVNCIKDKAENTVCSETQSAAETYSRSLTVVFLFFQSTWDTFLKKAYSLPFLKDTKSKPPMQQHLNSLTWDLCWEFAVSLMLQPSEGFNGRR